MASVVLIVAFTGGMAAAPVSSDASSRQAAERRALIDLARSTNASGWNRNRNWLSELPVCAWELVGCDSEGRVKILALDFNNLVGTLPPSIGDLLRLEDLDLEFNHLHGCLPSTLGNLDSLLQIGLGAQPA